MIYLKKNYRDKCLPRTRGTGTHSTCGVPCTLGIVYVTLVAKCCFVPTRMKFNSFFWGKKAILKHINFVPLSLVNANRVHRWFFGRIFRTFVLVCRF